MKNQYQIRSPYNDRCLGDFKFPSSDEISESISTLRNAKAKQKRLVPFEREATLTRLAGLLRDNFDRLAETITHESGKTISDSRIEINRAITTIKISAQEAGRINGIALNSDGVPPKRGRIGVVQWFPLGAVLAITPFNFPINIAAHKVGPAYAAGNAILFRPSHQNYLSSQIFVQLCYEAGMDRDVLQMCNAANQDMEAIVKHQEIECINFTGSVRIGKLIAHQAGMKRLIMELGGNDPLIVFPDANIENAVDTTIAQRFGTAGQRCTAAKQLLVHSSIVQEYTNLLIEKTAKLIVGDPMDELTDVGPLISHSAATQFSNAISDAKTKGATILAGDRCEGNLVYPTVMTDVPENCQVVREEVFGPVVPIRTFQKIDEVIEMVNSQPFGLQAGVFTQDINIAKQLHNSLEVATLAVNDGPGFRAEHFPFGGIKNSGLGNEGVVFATREMSFRKTLVF